MISVISDIGFSMGVCENFFLIFWTAGWCGKIKLMEKAAEMHQVWVFPRIILTPSTHNFRGHWLSNSRPIEDCRKEIICTEKFDLSHFVPHFFHNNSRQICLMCFVYQSLFPVLYLFYMYKLVTHNLLELCL